MTELNKNSSNNDRTCQYVHNAELIKFPKIVDSRGNLTFIEGRNHIPFNIQRAYWIYDVPGGETRGGHAYKTLQEVIIALSGSFDLCLMDGSKKKTFSLNRAYFGVYVPNMIWRELKNFSTNAVALILASNYFSEEDYIKNFSAYKRQNDIQ